MRSKKLIILAVCVLVLFAISSFAQTKKLTTIGRYTFVRIKGDVPTQEVMKTLVEKYAGDIKYGFDLAGYGDMYLPFLDQLKTATFEEKALPVGDKLMWMLFRSLGKVKIVQDVEWAGKAPLQVFSFVVRKDYKHYEFVMPKPCGNISLRKIEEIIPDAVCNLVVAPAKVNLKDTVTVDMSASQHAKSMTVEVMGPDGAKIATQSLTPQSPKWQTSFDKPGEYVFKGQAINAEGKASVNPCEAKTYVNFPPVCKLWTSCLPCEDYVGKPITFDASGSTDPDGEVVRADFEITDEAGNPVDKFMDMEKPFTWDKIFTKPGIYAVTCIVTDDFGAVSEPARIVFEVTQKRGFFLVDVGPLFARGSRGLYAAGRLGYMYMIVPDTLSFVISGGGALAFSGDPWKSFFLANVLLNVHTGPAYFGAGLGFTTKVKEERTGDAELLANIGFNVFDTFSTAGSIYFEGRGPVGEGKSFSKHHKLLLGFRLLF